MISGSHPAPVSAATSASSIGPNPPLYFTNQNGYPAWTTVNGHAALQLTPSGSGARGGVAYDALDYSGQPVGVSINGTYTQSGGVGLADGFTIMLFAQNGTGPLSYGNNSIPGVSGNVGNCRPSSPFVQGGVTFPNSTSQFFALQWDPFYTLEVVNGKTNASTPQFNLWVVNPSCSFVSSSGPLGCTIGIPATNDVIVFDAGYYPSASGNKLQAFVADVTSNTSCTFSLGLSIPQYGFQNPALGNYWFFVEANTGDGFADWTLYQVERWSLSPPFNQCPSVGGDTSCAILIVFNPDGTVTTVSDPSQGPFDGIEDTLIGVQNNRAKSINGISISGPGIFGLDGDGLCNAIPHPAGCPFGSSTYEGPGTSFTISNSNMGFVNFTSDLLPDGSGYFSLEGAINSTTITPSAPTDFTVSATSPPPVVPGSSAISTITVRALNGFSGTVTLTDTVPAGLTCNPINPNTATLPPSPATRSLNCTAPTAGTYIVTITGSNGTISHSTNATFTFLPPDFTISASSPPPAIIGSSATSTITLQAATQGFAGTVNLIDTVPAGLSCGPISPNSASLPPSPATATVTCVSDISGVYTVTITGTSGSISHSANATFTFFPGNTPPPFMNPRGPVGNWYPAGSQEQILSVNTYTDSTAQFNGLQTGQIDFTDWPLTASQQTTIPCSSSATITCSSPVAEKGYAGIEFDLAANLWGVPQNYGNSPGGVELRQGIAHLVNKQSFAANSPACLGTACVPNDDPTAVFGSVGNSELPPANPCNWDTKFTESSSSNCVVGAPGGTSYNCSFGSGCPMGILAGSATFPWQAAIGSPDFCAAAQHFIQAFVDAGIAGVTTTPNCELIPPPGGWPSSVTSINTAGCSGTVATANVCFFVSILQPRKSLGEGIAQDICALFSPAWTNGGWTTLAGQPFSCDNTNTGVGNAACGGGACPFLQEIEGPINAFCGFTTSTSGTPSNCWDMYTGDFANVFPFDQNMYYIYNSIFASKTISSPCASTTFTPVAEDYPYACSLTYDGLSNAMEYALCLNAIGDPGPGAAIPTFANCSGGTVGSGTGSTSCTTSACTAISAGYQTEDYFGSRALGIPVYSAIDVYGRLVNWPLGGATPGVIDAIGGPYEPGPNYFNWLNAYTATPAVAGTIRQGFAQTPDSLNPFIAETPQDLYILDSIYDTLFKTNPLCVESSQAASAYGVTQCSSKYQLIDWMTTSHVFLCYPGGPACTSTTLGYGNASYFAGTTTDLRLTLNRSNHWQDAGPVTAWDVKYSFINLNATGAFQASPLANLSHVNVLDEFTLDILLKARGPFTDYFVGSITIIPGHLWSACGASTWNSGVTGKNIAGTSIVNAPEDSCVGKFTSPNIVSVGGIPANSPTFDPVTNGFLIGSGPYVCESIGGPGHPAVGTIGGGCSIDDTQSPAPTLGAYTLTRTGCTLTATGTTCGVAGSSSDYFRSSGALATYIWTGDIGSASADFSRILTVNSCRSATPSPNCPHWRQGIGNPGGMGNNVVGLSQLLKVTGFKGTSWIAFSTEKTTGTQLILTCAAGYTLPGTIITPCTVSNAGWTTAVLPGIGAYASTLYEVGSTVLGTSTSTLAPASVVGCSAPIGTGSTYPIGGYDC